jgi:DNA-binding transcriptional regulator YhcF (GntR family)
MKEFVFTNDKPIYLQLLDFFKAGIISGEFKEGSRLDSVRELAVAAKVNPNTMQKALVELERLGLVRTERTSGRFITDDKEMIESMKKEFAKAEIESFLAKMQGYGFSQKQVLEFIESEINEKEDNE